MHALPPSDGRLQFPSARSYRSAQIVIGGWNGYTTPKHGFANATQFCYHRERYSVKRPTELRAWLKVAEKRNARFVIIVHDLVDYTDFPVYIEPDEELPKLIATYDKPDDMMHIAEIFSLTGRYTIEEQLNTERAWYLE
jgi:hypothetical protein